ncbi:hypothetical protein DC31_07575 [Microbacterium sp. CH12i]|nr:hypothetical protein DC31_07575 [Microbacterium sp. CH12i]
MAPSANVSGGTDAAPEGEYGIANGVGLAEGLGLVDCVGLGPEASARSDLGAHALAPSATAVTIAMLAMRRMLRLMPSELIHPLEDPWGLWITPAERVTQ